MRGKEYCKVEKKWCRFLNHNVCNKANCELNVVNRCPRLVEIETVRLYDILKKVTFDNVFERLCHLFENQESSIEGYREVFYKLRNMTPHKHNLTDLFIDINIIKEDDGTEWISVDGKDIIKNNGINYGIEFEKWNDWVSMFITQETLDNLTYEDIVAGCLYEMTFFGFTEEHVEEYENKLMQSVEECKAQLNGR